MFHHYGNLIKPIHYTDGYCDCQFLKFGFLNYPLISNTKTLKSQAFLYIFFAQHFYPSNN